MKPFCLFIVAMSLFAVANAQKLDSRQMEENARQWALRMGAAKSVAISRVDLEDIDRVAVFNIEGGGFVVVSGDSRARTVLGYSRTGRVSPAAMPDNMRYWLGEYQHQLEQLDVLYPDEMTEVSAPAKDALPDSIAPLLLTEWNQYRHGYNSLVPYDSTYASDSTMARFGNHPTVGCVALAMAQIMRYWQFPQHGYGSHSYSREDDTCWHYGTLSVDFSSTVYDYANMPFKLSDSSSVAEVNAVATLLYHCGVASNMGYNSDCRGSSGTSVQNCLAGMRHFFHYSMDSYQDFRGNHSDAEWDNMIMADLAAGRPVLYAGQSYRNDGEGTLAGAHAFVLDGYDTNGMFHINWGWDGTGNGYFSTSAMRPIPQYDFSYMQYALFNLEPACAVMVLGGDLTLESPRFQRGDSIRGHYSITNVGDSVGSWFFGVNIYSRSGGSYYGCVDGRRVRVAPGDTVWCPFAYPLDLEPGSYIALMQFSRDSFYAGIMEDRTHYMDDVEHTYEVDFEIVDTTYRNLTNLVVFVRFNGDPEIGTIFPVFREMFTGSGNSVYNFFDAISYGHILFNTAFARQHRSGQITSYTDPMPRSCFRPFSDDNPNGYTSPNPQTGISMLEAQLIARIARYIDSLHLVDADVNLDGNDDGNIDNLSIIVQGDVDGWGEMLWPHMEFFPHDSVGYTVTINGKRLNAFNFEFEGAGPNYFSTRVFCHEMCHSLGLPDLYHYNHHTHVTVVPFDILCSGQMCHPAAIYKHKFLHLGDEPKQITRNGTYFIYSNGSSAENNLYYIKSAIDSNQWYTIEYRNAGDPYEDALPYSGLKIGRWMDTLKHDIWHGGNGFADFATIPNAFYLFRPGSEIDTVDGSPSQCIFSHEQGRTEFGPYTNPHPFTADGTPERSFRIYDIIEYGTACSFSVEFLGEGISAPDAQKSVAELRLHPNPATTHVEVVWTQRAADSGDGQVTLLDAVGRQLMRTPVAGGHTQIDTRGLPPGVYFVTHTTTAGVASQKLIIQ